MQVSFKGIHGIHSSSQQYGPSTINAVYFLLNDEKKRDLSEFRAVTSSFEDPTDYNKFVYLDQVDDNLRLNGKQIDYNDDVLIKYLDQKLLKNVEDANQKQFLGFIAKKDSFAKNLLEMIETKDIASSFRQILNNKLQIAKRCCRF